MNATIFLLLSNLSHCYNFGLFCVEKWQLIADYIAANAEKIQANALGRMKNIKLKIATKWVEIKFSAIASELLKDNLKFSRMWG